MKVLFATHNQHKIKEVSQLLGAEFEIFSPSELGFNEDIEETGVTLTENALLKAIAYPKNLAPIIFAEDTGLEVEALNGAPGVYTARYAGEPPSHEKNMEKLLAALKNETNRTAQFKTIICLLKNGETHYFEGVCKGTIAHKMEGTEGFGYDPIFIPDGYKNSFAALGNDLKKQLSHRAMAIQKMVTFLKAN